MANPGSLAFAMPLGEDFGAREIEDAKGESREFGADVDGRCSEGCREVESRLQAALDVLTGRASRPRAEVS